MNEEINEESIDLRDFVDAIKKRWQLIVSITLIFTIAVTIISFFVIKPKYESNTLLFVGKDNTENQNQNQQTNANDIQMYQKLLKTYSTVITTEDLISKAMSDAKLDVSSETVLGGLTVTPQTDTQILEIKYVGTDKEQSKDIVEAVTNEFINKSSELVADPNVKVIQEPKVPNAPISPNKKLNISIAFLLGLIVGVGGAVLLEMLDTTFKTKKQLEEIVGLPVLGVIPDTEKVK